MLKFESAHLKRSTVNLIAAISCILVLSSCQEHKRLTTEINKTKLEAEALRTQLSTATEEYEMCVKSLNLLKSQQAKASGGPSSFEEKARKLEVEVNELTQRKNQLDQTVQRLQQDMEAYKQTSN